MKPIPGVSAPLTIEHYPAHRHGSETPVRYSETQLPGHQPGSPASLAAWLLDVMERVDAGDTLILPPAVFGLTTPLALPRGVSIIGAGMGLTTLTFTQPKSIGAYLRTEGDCTIRDIALSVIPDTKSRPTHLTDRNGEPYPNPAHYDAPAELAASALVEHHAEGDDEPATLRLSGVELRTGGYSLAPVGNGSHKWLIAATFDFSARGTKPGATIITPSSFTTKGNSDAKKRRTSTRSRTRTTRAAAG